MNLYTVFFYRNVPFLRIVLPLVMGILLQWHLKSELFDLSILLLASFLFTLVFSHIKPAQHFRFGWLLGLAINLNIATTGALLLTFKDSSVKTNSFRQSYTEGSTFLMRLNENVSEKASSYKARGIVTHTLKDGFWKTCGIQVIAYFEKTPGHRSLRYGDILLASGSLGRIRASGNPGAFDYKRYCYLQGIEYQVYLSGSNSCKTRFSRTVYIRRLVEQIRNFVLVVLRENIRGRQVTGLAEALLMGYKEDLDKDLVQSYAETGVVHVIAISGLHLGLIYGILLLVTRFLKGRGLKLIIILSGLWLFTLLAGASPSVVRSAVMFTCIAVGHSIGRNLTSFNSLSASAFILLCYDPLWLWDTGFQLSYAAVISILVFQKPVYQLLDPGNPLLDLVWKSCAITISAQILTTPVSLYYFNQFPTLFIVANLIAIPLSSLILILEILLCILALAKPVASGLGNIIGWLIGLMNRFVETVAMHPYASWQGIYLTHLQVILIYLIVISLAMFWLNRSKSALSAGFLLSVCFAALRTDSFLHAAAQEKIIVYNLPKQSAIEFIRGRTAIFMSDSSLKLNSAMQQFYIRPSRIMHRVHSVSSYELGGAFIYSKSRKKVLVVNQAVEMHRKPDIMVLYGNPYGSIHELCKGVRPGVIVFDASNTNWQTSRWKRECDSLGISSYSVSERGAFVMNLN